MRTVTITIGLLVLAVSPTAAQDTMAGYLQEEYSCIMCHTEMRADFLQGVHSRRGIQCTDCHGGDPTAFERETSASASPSRRRAQTRGRPPTRPMPKRTWATRGGPLPRKPMRARWRRMPGRRTRSRRRRKHRAPDRPRGPCPTSSTAW